MNITPLVEEEDVKAVERQLRSQWIGRGEQVARLEKTMADWVGVRYAVALGSGTAALAVAMKSIKGCTLFQYPQDICPALDIAARTAGVECGDGPLISIYPQTSGEIVDFCRHLPKRYEFILRNQVGVFSFRALKDVSGGIGGCAVSDKPIECEDMKMVSPLSDINAAMILSQLKRYEGKADYRRVADGTLWRMG